MKKTFIGALLLFFAPLVTNGQLIPGRDEKMLTEMSKQMHRYYDDSGKTIMESFPVGNGIQIAVYEYDSSKKMRLSGDILFVRAGNSWVSDQTQTTESAILEKIRGRVKKICY